MNANASGLPPEVSKAIVDALDKVADNATEIERARCYGIVIAWLRETGLYDVAPGPALLARLHGHDVDLDCNPKVKP